MEGFDFLSVDIWLNRQCNFCTRNPGPPAENMPTSYIKDPMVY